MAFLAALPAAVGTLMTAATATTAELAAASVTVAEASALAAGAGAAVSGYGTYKNSQYQAAVAKNNANIAANNEASSQMEGATQESISRQATARKVGGALAAQGANGVDVGFGTTKAVRDSLMQTGDLDAATIHYNASRNALGYITQQAGYAADAKMDQQAGLFGAAKGAFGVGASYIGGASSVANKWLGMKESGLGG